jgi:ABC-type transport system involved in cytochrome c biogenesis permease subunit
VTILALLLYSAAAVLYVAHFVRRGPAGGRVATGVFAAAALTHTFVIGMQTMEVGHPPFVGATGAVSGFVWMLALVYLYTEFTTEERAMGVLIAPLCALLQVIPAASGRVAARPPVLESPLFSIHVTSLLSAYAAFALACVIGITYVLLFKEIKAKHLGFFYARLPSLQTLDAMNARAVAIGWILLSVGVLVGGIWVMHARQYMPEDPRVQAMSLLDPKIFIALVSWAVYSFQIYARRAIGLSGRRAAWLSAIGFAIVLLNFLPVAYFFTRSHNFY